MRMSPSGDGLLQSRNDRQGWQHQVPESYTILYLIESMQLDNIFGVLLVYHLGAFTYAFELPQEHWGAAGPTLLCNYGESLCVISLLDRDKLRDSENTLKFNDNDSKTIRTK